MVVGRAELGVDVLGAGCGATVADMVAKIRADARLEVLRHGSVVCGKVDCFYLKSWLFVMLR